MQDDIITSQAATKLLEDCVFSNGSRKNSPVSCLPFQCTFAEDFLPMFLLLLHNLHLPRLLLTRLCHKLIWIFRLSFLGCILLQSSPDIPREKPRKKSKMTSSPLGLAFGVSRSRSKVQQESDGEGCYKPAQHLWQDASNRPLSPRQASSPSPSPTPTPSAAKQFLNTTNTKALHTPTST